MGYVRSCIAALTVGLLAAGALAQPAPGWRTDGTGTYSAARPTTQWSQDEHVLWTTPLANWGNATPVLAAGRLFVGMEPAALVCLNSADGKPLWEKSCSYLDLMSPEGQAKVVEQKKQGDALAEQIKPIQKELNQANETLRKTPDDAALKEKVKVLTAQIAPLRQQLAAISTWRTPETHDVNGLTSATPTSDGKRVCAVYGTGLVACYDMDGNRQWLRLIDKPRHNWGHSASPLLAGDKLIVQINDSVWCVNAADGKDLWKAASPQHWGSPVYAKIGGVEVVVTAGGDVIRLADGKVLCKKLAGLEFNAPLVSGDVVYFIQTESKAYRLAPDGPEAMKAQLLWQATIKKDRYYASPLLADGLIYGITQWGNLSVLDAATGALVYEQKLQLGKGTVYPSVTAAGDILLLSSDSGTTIVLKAGRTFQPLGKNTLPPFRGSIVLDGARMYVRAMKGVYCVGR